MVFADISGFTKMSERLARHGKVGAEEVTDAINTCFEQLLAIAYACGRQPVEVRRRRVAAPVRGRRPRDPSRARRGRHAAPAAHGRPAADVVGSRRAAHLDRRALRHRSTSSRSAIRTGSSLVAGPAATADRRGRGQRDRGRDRDERGDGRAAPGALLGARRAATGSCCARRRVGRRSSRSSRPTPSRSTSPRYVPIAIRRHLLDGGEDSEHRSATVAFLHFDGTDEILEREGHRGARRAARRGGAGVQRAVDEHEVTLLGSDIDHDGGKLILVSGVPRRRR